MQRSPRRRVAVTIRDRQVVEIARAHCGETELVDALARDTSSTTPTA